jgi:uncharacterized RDD family membrane protein YckC
VTADASMTADAERPYPGQRLGLPAEGRGAMAGIARRVAAFAIDAVIANLLAFAIFGDRGPGGVYVLGLFGLQVLVFTAFLGGSLGHLVTGLEVLRLDREPVGLWRAAIRTALLCLLIPVVIWDRDGRGGHDLAAGTVLVRRR